MSLPRTPKAVVFDMDGLLIDSESVYRDAMIAAAAEMGHELPIPLFLQMVGHSWPQNIGLLHDHFGPDFNVQQFRTSARDRFHAAATAEMTLKLGVVELLDLLDEIGLPRAIATSSQRREVDSHLGGHGLLERFHAVVAHGDYARGKPHPDPYLKAAEALGVDPRHCLALEDSHPGVRAASAAGMMTIMVPDLLEPTAEMHELCVRIARDLHEVHDLLRAGASRL
jgi:HAD superfamily hydrolase (TIGR01509 family)